MSRLTPFLCLLATLAQPSAPNPALEGTVLNSLTGQPIPNATITLQNEANSPAQRTTFTTRTDAAGHFRIPNLKPGAYQCSAELKGYYSQPESPDKTSKLVQLALDSPQPITFQLTPGAVVTGRIQDENGNPLRGAIVKLHQPRRQRGRNVYLSSATAITNDRGEYSAAGLRPGSYILLVHYHNDPLQLAGPAGEPIRHAPTFYPGVRDVASAQPLHLRAGQQVVADLTLQPQRLFHVRGRLLGIEITGQSHLEVALLPTDPALADFRFYVPHADARDGNFEFTRVLPGAYTVRARFIGDSNQAHFGAANLVITENNVEGLEIKLAPLQQMTGRLILDSPAPMPIDWTRLRVNAEALSGDPGVRESVTQSDGSFRQEFEAPGKYLLSVASGLPPNAYLASVRLGDVEYLGKPIDFTAGQPGPLSAIIRTDAAQLRCTVLPFEQTEFDELVAILLLPLDPRLQRHPFARDTFLSSSGTAEFRRVPPGDYLLLALPNSKARALLEGDDLTPEMQKAAARVHIEPNGKYDIEVKLHRPPEP